MRIFQLVLFGNFASEEVQAHLPETSRDPEPSGFHSTESLEEGMSAQETDDTEAVRMEARLHHSKNSFRV
jgi:hypothetical protein